MARMAVPALEVFAIVDFHGDALNAGAENVWKRKSPIIRLVRAVGACRVRRL